MLLPTQIEEVMQDSRELAYLVIVWINHILLKSFA